MKPPVLRLRPIGALVLACLALNGCTPSTPRDFGGFWKPVNRFDRKVNEVPLATPYVYYASSTDGTLKRLLTRWSRDTDTTLSYRLRSDFTLPKAAGRIHSSEARDATTQLNAIYTAQGIRVAFEGAQLIVEEAHADTADGAQVP
ncbi:hypothetical protein [Luteibacter sahnii]|uniref:hypothetical protein n=1 Tax=Luteibacter sahnii TaxID=3021977 RepID=UPI002A6AA4A2|nr:hypothetical protein [Luteibacter sp. PPL193]MDY1546689.1 hypothetical protein [Luteibacter sp. PPL193]